MDYKNKYNMTQEENVFLARRNIVDNIYSSARVEGINITFPQTKAILEGSNVASLKIDDITSVLNLKDAWKYLILNVNEKLDLNFICKINEYVVRNESLEWGKLRTGKVEITGTNYIPSIPQKEEIEKEIENILNIENDTQRAITYMLYGMRSKLFWDGNKRTSTIVANKIMIENGRGIIKIPDKLIEEFNILLTEYYNSNDMKKLEKWIYDNCIDGIKFE